MTDPVLELTEDAFLGGQLRLRQLKSGHRAGHDAVLLAAATSARNKLSWLRASTANWYLTMKASSRMAMSSRLPAPELDGEINEGR